MQNVCPGNVNAILPFDKDKWELYKVDEDFSESTDLSAQYPEKLEELKQIFDEEAWKYNVYPLYDDMITRELLNSKTGYSVAKRILFIIIQVLFELEKRLLLR